MSVFKIDESLQQLSQLIAEFYASRPDGRFEKPRDLDHFDVTGLSPRETQSDGDSLFAFSRRAHHVVPFHSADELRDFAAKLLDQANARLLRVTPVDMKRHVRAKLANNDPEWTAAIERMPNIRTWAESTKGEPGPAIKKAKTGHGGDSDTNA